MKKIKEVLEGIPFYNQAVRPYHFVRAVFAGAKYHFPAKKMTVIGVTGTNGKTTTCFMIWKMLNEAGYKAGLMTTVAWGVDKLEKQVEHMTTVSSELLNQRIEAIRKQGAEYLVLETTSHALMQFRTLGVPIEIAVMTNVTHEHLDYHGTFEKYRDAKRKLFRQARFGVINADDKSAKYFKKDVGGYITYGIKSGKMRAENIQLTPKGVKYKYSSGDIIQVNIPGKFNVYNSLAAICVGEKLGLSMTEIKRGIGSLVEVEGRMNRVEMGQDFDVIVDYAHTPDAISKVFESVKGATGKVIALHGGAGRRDESTRAERGEILGKGSDVVIITEDDSRDEDPKKIAEQFVSGVEKAGKVLGKDLFVELDRKKAIRQALSMAKKGDLVLILGKGHEKTILRADGAHKFEDLKVVRELLKEMVK